MFKVISCSSVGQNYKAYLQAIVQAQASEYPFSYHDLATYADCPARWRGTELPLEDRLEVFDNMLALAATDPQGFAKTYALPPASLQETVLVCPGCGSIGKGTRCGKCGVTRRARQQARDFSPASTAGKLWKAEAIRRGLYPLAAGKAERLVAAVDALHNDKAIASVGADALTMLAITADWTDDAGRSAVRVTALVSLLPNAWSETEGGIVCLVGCQSAHPTAFAIATYRRALHVRAALEIDLVAAAGKGPVTQYLIAGVEYDPPHLVARRKLTPDAISAGRDVYCSALSNLMVSRAESFWPDYDTGGREELGWSDIDPEDSLHNQARSLLCPPLTVGPTGRAVPFSPPAEVV